MDVNKIMQSILVKNTFSTQELNYAVFDFDYTTINNDIADLVLLHLCQNNLLRNKFLLPKSSKINSPKTTAQYHEAVYQYYWKYHELGDPIAFKFITNALAGFTKKEIKIIVEKVIKENKKTETWCYGGLCIPKGIKVRSEIKSMMQYLLKHKVQVHIVSASPQVIIVNAIKSLLPNLPLKIHGIEQQTARNKLTPDLIPPLTGYHGKVQKIKQFAGTKKPLIAVGDSPNDEFMLQYAQNAFVINRNTPFSKQAKLRGWHLIEPSN